MASKERPPFPPRPEDLVVFDWNEYRTSMLQDAIFAREAWLNEGDNRDVAVRFVER